MSRGESQQTISRWISYQNNQDGQYQDDNTKPTDNIKMDSIPNKMKLKHALFVLFTFQVLKALLIKICKIEPPDLLIIVVFISFYISRYHFSQIFRTSFNIWKNIFVTNFSFLMNSLTPPSPPPLSHPLNGQNPLSMTKVVHQSSLNWMSNKANSP